MTSHDVINRIRRLYSTKRVGHTGTLDPMATGVLVVLVGRAAKAAEYLVADSKEYVATLRLGIETDTEDTMGTVLKNSDYIPSQEEVLNAVSSFVGDVMQTPPMYSALKVDGKKLCDLARRGETIERDARPVTVYSIKAERINDREYYLDVVCSKGTYIRTLCADIGASLGVGGAMKTLKRLSASGYTIDEARTLGELEAMSQEEREALVYPVEDVFKKYESVTLSDFFSRLAHAGQEIYLHKIGKSFPVDTVLRISDRDGFFAVGEVKEFDLGVAIKPIRQF
jgi:tRNA pseudouridine55 synthase